MATRPRPPRALPADACRTEHEMRDDGTPGALCGLLHAGHAYVEDLAPAASPESVADAVYQSVAWRYLSGLPEGLRPPDWAIASLQPRAATPAAPGLRWRPVAWGGHKAHRPALIDASYWLVRRTDDAPHEQDACLVLLAARQDQGQALGDGIGLRLLLSVQRGQRDGDRHALRVSLHGWSGSGLTAEPPAAPPAALDARTPQRSLLRMNRRVAQALGLEWVQLRRISGHRGAAQPGWRLDDDVLQLQGLGRKAGDPHVYAFNVELDGNARVRRTLSLQALPAAGAAQVFERDPASCGPIDSLAQRAPHVGSARLSAWCVPLREGVLGGTRDLSAHSAGPLWQVDGSAPTPTPGDARRLAVPDTPAASLYEAQFDDQQTHFRAQEFFDRLRAYGFDPGDVFRMAALPLWFRAAAPLPSRDEAMSVNAQVRPFWRKPAHLTRQGAALRAGLKPSLLVSLSAADLRHREIRPRSLDGGGQEARYLGIAADPRWTWHEMGHVLTFAATGELELPFAHSPGDALAAIATDPDSTLAWDAQLRHQTFPWVSIDRRHDRTPAGGYGWCSCRNALHTGRRVALGQYRHGYLQEQMLSSTLFRLYRAIGGDTRTGRPDREAGGPAEVNLAQLAVRRSASDYCIYLIMRALASLGPDGIAPARSPGQFMQALIEADLGTAGTWRCTAPWPYRDAAPRRLQRLGGVAHKVIRWAFEQQGLDAAPSGQASEQAGPPPAVDVFIGDRRREHRAPDGGYWPVPLDDAQPDAPWLMRLARDGQAPPAVQVLVGNRGGRPSGPLRWRAWAGQPARDDWHWQPLALGTAARLQPLAAGETRWQALALPRPPAQGAWLLLALDCAADPALLPAGARPPRDADALRERVSQDNNLGLAAWA